MLFYPDPFKQLLKHPKMSALIIPNVGPDADRRHCDSRV